MSSPQESPNAPAGGPMPPNRRRLVGIVWGLALLAALALLLWAFWGPLQELSGEIWRLVKNQDAFRRRIESYGAWAPAAYIVLQIIQVVISPVPNELVGPIGVYVLGWFTGSVCTTIGLSLGSWMAFFAARLLGQGFVERLVSPKTMAKAARFMERQGAVASFILFSVPGFPKDYYCYALGLSPMNWKVFMLVSSLGRIPATIVYAIQGSMLANGQYVSFAVVTVVSLVFFVPVWLFRERIYGWLDRLDQGRGTAD